MYSEKFLKNSINLLTSPFLVVLQTSFTQKYLKENWALQGHAKGNLRIPQGHSASKGYLGPRSLKAFGHWST